MTNLDDDAQDDELPIPGDHEMLPIIRRLSFEKKTRGVVEACESYRVSGGLLFIYGPYLYPALAALGEFDAALQVTSECSDDVNTPVDELKILFLAKRFIDVARLSTTIIENSVWFGGGRDVVDALLMRAECLRMGGFCFRAWQDIQSAYQLAEQGGLSAKVFADIRSVRKRIRMEAANPVLGLSPEPSSFVPVVLGGPHFEGQSSCPE